MRGVRPGEVQDPGAGDVFELLLPGVVSGQLVPGLRELGGPGEAGGGGGAQATVFAGDEEEVRGLRGRVLARAERERGGFVLVVLPAPQARGEAKKDGNKNLM